MKTIILEPILHLIIVLPILFLFLRKKDSESFLTAVVFSLYFLINAILVHLPIDFEKINVLGGNWNWTGKILGIIGSITFLLIYKKFKLKDYYLTLEQDKSFIKKGILVVTLLLVLQIIQGLLTGSPKEWSMETFLFQLTMPGIQEEIAFRGIMMGLLVKILKPSSKSIFHPAIIITSILFGMAHGLILNDSLIPSFRLFPFINTMILGIIWGWITLKSGSVLLAVISHNLGNVIQYILRLK